MIEGEGGVEHNIIYYYYISVYIRRIMVDPADGSGARKDAVGVTVGYDLQV